jgi:hypothetical protein
MLDHLLIQCEYNRETWFKILRCLGWHQFTPTTTDIAVDWRLRTRKLVAKARFKSFDPLVSLVGWSLWLERNNRVFRTSRSLVAALVLKIKNSVDQWVHAGLINRSDLLGE